MKWKNIICFCGALVLVIVIGIVSAVIASNNHKNVNTTDQESEGMEASNLCNNSETSSVAASKETVQPDSNGVDSKNSEDNSIAESKSAEEKSSLEVESAKAEKERIQNQVDEQKQSVSDAVKEVESKRDATIQSAQQAIDHVRSQIENANIEMDKAKKPNK